MGLAATLSAIRELILDLRDIPETEAERRSLYQRRFPGLTTPEVEDLARIPPAHLGVYTRSIFVGERRILQARFEVTFALLERHWSRVYGEPFNSLTFVRRIHDHHPWRNRGTAPLGWSLVALIEENLPALLEACPVLPDMARLEALAVEVRHAPDDAWGPGDTIGPEELTTLTVSELLAIELSIPTCVRLRGFSFNPVELRRSFYAHDETLPAVLPTGPCWSAAGRNRAGFPRWVNLPAGLFERLEAQPRLTPLPIESLAEAFVAGNGTRSEVEHLREFLDLLGQLSEAGVVLLPPRGR